MRKKKWNGEKTKSNEKKRRKEK